jgi:chemotaxis methyl-accepting protein methylase
VTGEAKRLLLVTEDRMGIKADESDLEKFRSYLIKTYGSEYEAPAVLEKVFNSGEAANFLTVNETYFFREPSHFKLLQNVLPDFQGSLRICSAATSSGCEAYSIAAVLENYNAGHKPVPYRIDAFDINPQVIAAALGGVYGRHSLREDGSCYRYLLDPYLEEGKDAYTLKSSLREHIRFFVHNIMDPLILDPRSGECYDIVFFRNAFIYFSQRNRGRILSNLASSMKEDALLFMGVSETAGVHHSLLIEENSSDVFYFRKNSASPVQPEKKPPVPEEGGGLGRLPRNAGSFSPSAAAAGEKDLRIDPALVATILAGEKEGADVAFRVGEKVKQGGPCDGNELAASVLFLLNRGDFYGADPVLRFIEGRDGSAFTAFLRGEYYYFQDLFTEAEFHYKISLGKNSGFWPAQYRLSSLAGAGVLRDYRARQAGESLRRGRDLRYEVFIGGFSPDYYLGVLLKKHV